MNQEDILKMAREAGFKANSFSPIIARHSNGSFVDMQSEVERFAVLVAAKAAQDEREQCAKLCDEMMKREMTSAGENDGRGSDIAFGRMAGAECLADAIRARV